MTQISETIALPQIIGQPQVQIVMPGNSASFSVVVADTRGVSYQWLFNGSPISGATADSVLITNVSTNSEGAYSVMVGNGSGSIPSNPANLYIDTDGDGLPDSWEIAQFGNLAQTATGDPDGDGVSNLQEFFDGTNPTNAASAQYRITLFEDGGTVTRSLDQPAYPKGQVVTLTATGNAATPFHAWTGDVTTRSNSITLTMTNNYTLFAHFLPFTMTWTNAAGGDWNIPSNWTPNLSPGSNESAVIISQSVVTLNTDVALVNFTLGSSSLGSVLTGSGAISVSGVGNWDGGAMNGSGSTIVLPGAIFMLNDNGTLYMTGRTFENRGTTLWAGNNLNVNGSTITNGSGAQFYILNSATFNFQGGVPRLDNAGTLFTPTNGTINFYNTAFNNYGDVQNSANLLNLSGGGLNSGTINIPSGNTMIIGGNYNNNSLGVITGGGILQVAGNTVNLGGTVNVTGSNYFTAGTANITGNYTCVNHTLLDIGGSSVNFDGIGMVAPNILNLNGGLGGGNTIQVKSRLNWNGGTMYGSGRTVIQNGATLNIANFTGYGGVYLVDSHILENAGIIQWGGGNMGMSGVITNDPGATVLMNGPLNFNYYGGSPHFDNAGTWVLSSSARNVSLNNIALNNYGTLNLQGGALTANGGYSCASNSILSCALGGTVGGATYAQLRASGSVNVKGSMNVYLTNYYVPKTNDSFAVLTAASVSGTFANFTYPSNNLSMLVTNTPTSETLKVTTVSSKQTNSVPTPAGMISWWRAENNAIDSIGTNNGTLSNGVSFAAGEVGQSFLFDGTSGYVSIPDSASLRPVSVTVEAWVKIFSTNAIQLVFAKPLGTATLDSYGLALQNGVPLAAICDNNDFGAFLSDTTALTLGQWHHMAFTFDAATGFEALYTDGGLVASANAGRAMNFDNHPLLLGGDNDNTVSDNFLNGQIDEASIYNRALTPDEIASIANAGPGGKQIVSTVSLPVLHIQAATPATARLFWSTNFPNYRLEYNVALGNTNWAALGATPVIVGTNYVVTNVISGTFQFYRLSNH